MLLCQTKFIFLPLPLEEICTLVIAEVFPEDSGIFTCTASNKYGTVSSIAALKVKGNISVTNHKKDEKLSDSVSQCGVFKSYPSL